ncbi:outer membrane beta-barrel protein [Rufibacter roseus]|uniref:Outer membrane beta-barrel protein n=1 Tax=Rufibacter roseus TaxID=1567108 RepID=A0ABW2DIU9_9BACT|nr:outer membrane beta-barrel protein [Rufibacter roseus]
MKKVFFTIFLFSCLIASAQAQTEKGARLIGGSGSLYIDTEGPDNTTALSLTPRFGTFVADNIALGTGIPVAYSTTDYYKLYTIGLTPFVRGYFGSSPTKLLLEGRAGYNRVGTNFNDDYNYMNRPDAEGYFSYGFGAGVTQFLNEHVGIELMLNYDKANLSSNTFQSRGLTGITLNLGFQIYLSSVLSQITDPN